MVLPLTLNHRGLLRASALAGALFLLTVGPCCSTYTDLRTTPTIDPELQPYVNSWSAEFGAGSRLSAHLVAEVDPGLDSEAIAWCTEYTDGSSLIRVHRAWWEGATQAEREVTLWHELGHCWGRLSCHNDTQVPVTGTVWTRSASVMAAYIDHTWPWWPKFRPAYVKELQDALADPEAYCEGRSL